MQAGCYRPGVKAAGGKLAERGTPSVIQRNLASVVGILEAYPVCGCRLVPALTADTDESACYRPVLFHMPIPAEFAIRKLGLKQVIELLLHVIGWGALIFVIRVAMSAMVHAAMCMFTRTVGLGAIAG